MQIQNPREYSFDDFRLDLRKRQLLRDDKVVKLNPRAFDLLRVLVENAGKLLSKDELIDRVWAGQIVEDSNLTVNMSAIRRALGEAATQPRYITTVSGEGYCFVGDLSGDKSAEEEYVVESRIVSRVIVDQENVAGDHLPETAGKGSNVRWYATRAIIAVAFITLLGAGGYIGARAFLSKDPGASRGPVVTSIRKLTNTGKVGTAALSPDGRMFAFSMHEGERSSLWLGYVDGGEPIRIRPAAETIYRFLKFSPDGSNLYLVLSENYRRGELYRIPVLGGALEKLADDVISTVTFAPDGKQMAFVRSDRESGKQLLTVSDPQAGDMRPIAECPSDSSIAGNTPAWSPDGKTIAIAAAKNDGSAVRIFIAGPVDKSFEPMVVTADWSAISGLAWLHDGTGLIVVAREKEKLAPQLWQIAFPGGDSRRLVTDLNLYSGSISLSDGDKDLLAVQTQIESNLWVSPADDLGKVKQITFGSPGQNNGWNGLDWHVDNRIIYTKQVNDNISIWSCSPDGADQKQLIPGGGINILPSVAVDGKYIIFQSNRGGADAVWRSDIDGNNLLKLSGDDIATQPRVSPNGNWVVYESGSAENGRLSRVAINGGDPVRLTETRFDWVDISPDASLIAGGCDDGGKPHLCILSVDGGRWIKLFDIPRLANFRLGVRWTPDGQSITYRDWVNGVWRQSLAGGEPELIKDLPEEKLYSYGWSPDGKQFLFTRGSTIDDVVFISGVR